MSTEALSWTLERSPLTGTALVLHIMLADLTNTKHGNELWARQEVMAFWARTTRGTVSRLLAEMVGAGLLELIATTSFGTNRYRFLMDSARYPIREAPKMRVRDPRTPTRPPVPSVVRGSATPPVRDSATPSVRDPATQNVKGDLPKETPTSSPQPPAKKGTPKGRQYSDEAQALATAEWERRTIKPAIGFVGFRKGIDAALAAGHTVEDLARVLPSMSNFSPNAFDFVLGGKGRNGRPGLRSVPPPSTDRDAPTGRIAT